MSRCDCGAETTRLKLLTQKPWNWVCSRCKPEEFPAERFGSPTDKQIWLAAEAYPEQYETRDGVKQMKDWAQAEFEQRISREDEDEVKQREAAKDRKRQQAREARTIYGDRISPEVQKRLDEQLTEQMTRARCIDAGLVLP